MSFQADYDALLETLKAIPPEQVKRPPMPAATYAQEAVNLAHWAAKDRKELEGAGLDWGLVECLPRGAGALRHAQTLWLFSRYDRKKAWALEYPQANDMRISIAHAFKHAFTNDPELVSKVRKITEGDRQADLVRQLMDLAVLGRRHPALLEAVCFDTGLLDKAAQLSQRLSVLLADHRTSPDLNEFKDIRDRAGVYLKGPVAAIREKGKYVFWRNKERLPGYSSEYFRKLREKRKSASAGR